MSGLTGVSFASAPIRPSEVTTPSILDSSANAVATSAQRALSSQPTHAKSLKDRVILGLAILPLIEIGYSTHPNRTLSLRTILTRLQEGSKQAQADDLAATAIKHVESLSSYLDEDLISALREHLIDVHPLKTLANALQKAGLLHCNSQTVKERILERVMSYAAILDPSSPEIDLLIELSYYVIREVKGLGIGDPDDLSTTTREVAETAVALYSQAYSIKQGDSILGPSMDVSFFAQLAGIDSLSEVPPLSAKKFRILTLILEIAFGLLLDAAYERIEQSIEQNRSVLEECEERSKSSLLRAVSRKKGITKGKIEQVISRKPVEAIHRELCMKKLDPLPFLQDQWKKYGDRSPLLDRNDVTTRNFLKDVLAFLETVGEDRSFAKSAGYVTESMILDFIPVLCFIKKRIKLELIKVEAALTKRIKEYSEISFDDLVAFDEVGGEGSQRPISPSSLFHSSEFLFAPDSLEIPSVEEEGAIEASHAAIPSIVTFTPTTTFTVASILKHLLQSCSFPGSSRNLVEESKSHLVLAGIDFHLLFEALCTRNLDLFKTAASMLIVDTHVGMEQSLKALLPPEKRESFRSDHSLLSLALQLERPMSEERRAFLEGSYLGIIWARYFEASSAGWHRGKPSLLACLETVQRLRDLDSEENQEDATKAFAQLKDHLFQATKVVCSDPETDFSLLQAHLDSLEPSYISTKESPPTPLETSIAQAESVLASLLSSDFIDDTTKVKLNEIRHYFSWLRSAISRTSNTDGISSYWNTRLLLGSVDKMYEMLYIAACHFHGMGDVRSHNLGDLLEKISAKQPSSLSKSEAAIVADFNIGNAFHYSRQYSNPRSQVLLRILDHSLSHVGVEEGFTPAGLQNKVTLLKKELFEQVERALHLWMREAQTLFTVPARAGAGSE